jgi:hypothetical protein
VVSELATVIKGESFESFFGDGLEKFPAGFGGGVGSLIRQGIAESPHRFSFSKNEDVLRILLEGHDEIRLPMSVEMDTRLEFGWLPLPGSF